MSLHKVFAHSRALFARNAPISKFATEQAVRNNHVVLTPATERISLKVKKDEKKGKKSELISNKGNISKVKEGQLISNKKSKKSSVEQKKLIVKNNENLKNSVKTFSNAPNNNAPIKPVTFIKFVKRNLHKDIENINNSRHINVVQPHISDSVTSETEKTPEKNKNKEFENNFKNNKTKNCSSGNLKFSKSLIKANKKKINFIIKKPKKVATVKKKGFNTKRNYNKIQQKKSFLKKNFIKTENSEESKKTVKRNFSLSKSEKLKICFWNVAGLKNKNYKFWKFVREMDVVGFLETWVSARRWTSMKRRLPKEYNWKCSFAKKRKRKGRPKGGILFGVRNEIAVGNENYITSNEIIESTIILGNKTIKIVTIYNPASLKDLEDEFLWNILDKEIDSSEFLIIGGDFNARTGNKGGIELNGIKQERISKDKVINKSGRKLLELCEKKKWTILNGNMELGLGKSTFCGVNSFSVIDYIIVNEKMLPFIEKFNVVSRIESDHMPLKLELNLKKLMSEENGVLPQLQKQDVAIPKEKTL